VDQVEFLRTQHKYSLLLTMDVHLITVQERIMENDQDGFRVIIRGDAIDGERGTFSALMDQHQLATRLQPVPVPALLHGQPDGPHLPLARGKTIARGKQIEMAGPQTVRTVIAVIHTRKHVRGGDKIVAVRAPEISKRGKMISHSSLRRFM
jgi:hypothetical protein